MRSVWVALVGVALACGGAPPPPASGGAEAVVVMAQASTEALQQARREQASVDATRLAEAVSMHVVAEAACPADVAALARKRMIERVPDDPWGHGFVLACRDGGAAIEVRSPGPDGTVGNADDVVVTRP